MLLCELIPQEKMYRYKWFAPVDHKNWYYFLPRENIETVFDIHPDLIYKTLDPELKELFKFVAGKDYKTLPSCSGHFHNGQEIKEKYHSILSDLIKIKNKDFVIKDIESSKKYNYGNSNYELPWAGFKDFEEDVKNHMNFGYFGIVNPIGLEEFQAGPIKFKKEIIGDNNVFHIILNSRSPEDLEDNWNFVFEVLKRKLK